jgi:carboxymethylenebutenolidase
MSKVPQPIIDLYDAYTHGQVDRRTFLANLARLAGGAAAATALLPVLANDYALAALTQEDDPRLKIFEKTFTVSITPAEMRVQPAAGAISRSVLSLKLPMIRAYGARLKKKSIAPAIVVIHENRGLNAHVKDVARRIALEGFHAFAVDMLTPFGGTPADEDEARTMIGGLNREETAGQLAEIVKQLFMVKTHRRHVGAVGFCWGGGMVNALAAASPELKAGVVYYGSQPKADEVAGIKASLLLHYAGLDDRINAGAQAYDAALKEAGVEAASYVYPGAQHAFNNDANAARYDRAAAELAWSRTTAFLKEKLG